MIEHLRPPPSACLQAPLLKWVASLPHDEGALTLDLNGRGASDKVIAALAKWPGLASVQHLDLSGNRFTGDALPALLDVVAPRLKTLNLSKNPRLREQGFATIADQRWPALEVLRVRFTKLRKGLAALEKLDAPQLEVLDAYDAGFGAAGAIALASSTILPQLKVLDFENGDPGQSGFTALKRVLPTTAIEQLGLGRRVLDKDLLEALLDGPIKDSLRALSIENDDPATLAPLAGMRLESLKAGAGTFHRLPELPHLRRLQRSYTGGMIVGPLPAALLEQLEVLQCTFSDEHCGLADLARSTKLRVFAVQGGSATGLDALKHARFLPYLEAAVINVARAGSDRNKILGEFFARAESLHTLELHSFWDQDETVLRSAGHLDIERVVTTEGQLERWGDDVVNSSPILQRAAQVFVSVEGTMKADLRKTFGSRVRLRCGEPIDVLAGLDYIR